MVEQQPERFPKEMAPGFPLHDGSVSVQPDLLRRRITWQAPGSVFPLRPSFVMPSLMGRPEEVAKALSLRQWGVPFAAWAYGFGRDALCWSRAWLACGRSSLVGTPVQAPHQVPRALVAEETRTRGAK